MMKICISCCLYNLLFFYFFTYIYICLCVYLQSLYGVLFIFLLIRVKIIKEIVKKKGVNEEEVEKVRIIRKFPDVSHADNREAHACVKMLFSPVLSLSRRRWTRRLLLVICGSIVINIIIYWRNNIAARMWLHVREFFILILTLLSFDSPLTVI